MELQAPAARAGRKTVAWPCAGLLAIASTSPAQIGGKTAADGPFVVDNFEDLNLASETLARNWITSVIVNAPASLQLSGPGDTLAPGQTPIGAMQPRFPDDNAFIFGSPNSVFGDVGIPVPGLPGVSTDPNAGGTPGNITSLSENRFVHSFTMFGQRADTDYSASVVIECYPGNGDGTFPKLIYNYEPTRGTVFTPVEINLRDPSVIRDNPQARTVEQLLSQTRFLDFFFFATPTNEPSWMNMAIDDITLVGPASSVDEWMLY